MKKSLIASSILAASGAASAQSQVTLYGLIDTYVASIKRPDATGGHVTQTVVNGGGIKPSAIGFSGSEDLGDGLKAIFKLEGNFDPSTGVSNNVNSYYTGSSSASIFNNGSYVGFVGGFGEVRVGRFVTPYDDAKGLGAGGFNANIFAPASFVWASNAYQDKPGNSVYYRTPGFGGLSLSTAYSLGENNTDTTSAGEVISLNLTYAGGPLLAMLSYQTEKRSGDDATTKFLQVNASYDIGTVKLRGALGRVQDKVETIDATHEYQVGLDVPVNDFFTVSGGYAWSKDNVIAGDDIKRQGFGVAGIYAFSKRSSLYGGMNESHRQVPGASDAKTRVLAIGIRHAF